MLEGELVSFEEMPETALRPPQKDRLTAVDKLYHVPANGEASVFESTFERKLVSDEQPYSRRCKATEEWRSLDLGWIQPDQIGMLMIRNEEGKFFSRRPTQEEAAESAERILEVAYANSPPWLILPGESMRGLPVASNPLMIRCHKGAATYSVFVVPR